MFAKPLTGRGRFEKGILKRVGACLAAERLRNSGRAGAVRARKVTKVTGPTQAVTLIKPAEMLGVAAKSDTPGVRRKTNGLKELAAIGCRAGDWPSAAV